MFYVIFNGCENGQDVNKNQLAEVLKKAKCKLGYSFKNNWILIDNYGKFVGSLLKL